ncbi:S66 peptidase family protein [Marinisporobacter balticus]|uniref:Muramoyltetrapeptide carboxypeptidase n=1 Tax=Marinisporobacter balticus TaxID=2018667 RepID=A0A4V2SAB5_9FIRM|nr:LD-carboxypeptidase [Marinisporobacter balticus]TCO71050.1 muramoyltetrapeptide carboxypeptidase [Marinisporobacter balticus]
MIVPKGLKHGDTIGVIAPASPVTKEQADTAKTVLEEMGFKVKMGDSCYASFGGYLSGEDTIRARDLNNMFMDNQVDAIICIRGGYGCARMIDQLDMDTIQKNPKIFIGYSDITALHLLLNQKANLATYHGPMVVSNMLKFNQFTKSSFFHVMNAEEDIELNNPKNDPIKTMVEGCAKGPIVGGNLALIATTMGTPYEIETKGKILFIEDIGEKPYSIDRMLTQLRLAGKLNDCEGIILGDFADCEDTEGFTAFEVFNNIIKPFFKPTIYNFKSGHCESMITLPLGRVCELDATNKKVIIKN